MKNFQQLNETYEVENIYGYLLDCAINGNKISEIYHEMDYNTKQGFIDYLFDYCCKDSSIIKTAVIKIIKEIAR